MKLYDNAFSPFARKVLEYKGLAFDAIDGLDKSNHDALVAVNGRVEVPALVDGVVVVVNSADIVAHLEHKYPERSVYPADPAARVRARAWERCADTVIDPILVDISYWSWADRPDEVPAGLREAAQTDLNRIYDALERDLASCDHVCGEFSIADIALYAYTHVAREGGFELDRFPSVTAWLERAAARPRHIGITDDVGERVPWP